MPYGKPAGIPCINLLEDYRCGIFGDPARPAVCASLQPSPDLCGTDRVDALRLITRMERDTRP